MKKSLANIGSLMALYGLLSIVLYSINYNLRIMMWVDQWNTISSPALGWVIRTAFLLVGGALYWICNDTKEVTNA